MISSLASASGCCWCYYRVSVFVCRTSLSLCFGVGYMSHRLFIVFLIIPAAYWHTYRSKIKIIWSFKSFFINIASSYKYNIVESFHDTFPCTKNAKITEYHFVSMHATISSFSQLNLERQLPSSLLLPLLVRRIANCIFMMRNFRLR